MKAYGYAKQNDSEVQELREVTLEVSSTTLRTIADFFNKAADDMDTMGDKFWHEHFQDFVENWSNENSDIIVMKKSDS